MAFNWANLASSSGTASAPAPSPSVSWTQQQLEEKWGPGAQLVQGQDGAYVYSPTQDINIPVDANNPLQQDLVRTNQGSSVDVFTDTIMPLAFGAAAGSVGGLAFGAGPLSGATTTGAGEAATVGAGDMFGSGAAYDAGVAGLGETAAVGAGGITLGEAVPPVDAGVGGAPYAPGSFTTDPMTGDVTGLGGNTAAGTAAGATAGGTALSRLLGGNATDADMLSVFGNLGAAGLGYLGADRASERQDALAREYMALGAPSRARYEESFAPGFNPEDMPGYQQTLDTSYDTMLRRLSAQGGNPFGNPAGTAEAMKYVTGNVALPALQEYRRQNAGAGGLATLTAAAPAAAAGAITSEGGKYDAIGGALADLTNPRRSLSDYLRAASLV